MYLNSNLSIKNVRNIDNRDLLVRYDGVDHAIIEAGETMALPHDLAEHAIDALTTRILMREGKNPFNEKDRKRLRERIVIGEAPSGVAEKKSKAEQLKAQVAELNRREPVVDEVAPDEVYDDGGTPDVEEVYADDPVFDDEPDNTPSTVADVKVAMDHAQTMPTRQELYDYAGENGFVLTDPKTFRYFESLSVKDLIKELDYPLNEE